MDELAIRVSRLTKKYIIGVRSESYRTLRDAIGDGIRKPFRPKRPVTNASVFWALRGIDLEIKRGEILGIIGRNGAGKTTLLKILSRITEPTSGFAEIWGRVGCLLEVGTGFHQELTGRENIYLNGAILGMGKSEIKQKMDAIVSFAEVEKFLDTPVKRYSSGMYLRLAFAVAAHLEPEILMVDEVLAVGDVSFQNKCLGKMSEVAKQERTILFVSHNMSAVAQLCRKVVWLEEGRIKKVGPPNEVIGEYLASEAVTESTWYNPDADSAKSVAITSAKIQSVGDQPASVVKFSESFQIQIGYLVSEPIRNVAILARVTDLLGNVVWTSWDTDTTDWKGKNRDVGRYCSTCLVPDSLLRPGRYFLSVGAYVNNVASLDSNDHVLAFDVSAVDYPINLDRVGIVTPLFEWTVSRTEAEPANVSELRVS